jgi:hypothetical protein
MLVNEDGHETSVYFDDEFSDPPMWIAEAHIPNRGWYEIGWAKTQEELIDLCGLRNDDEET